MSKIDYLLTSIAAIVKAEQEDIVESVPDFPGLDKIPDHIEAFEAKVARLLRRQRKYFIDSINEFVAKDITLAALLVYLQQDLFAADEFAEAMEGAANEYLTMTISELTSEMMEAIDKDVAFQTLSGRTTSWISEWAFDLSQLMQLNTHRAIEDELSEVIAAGESIEQASLRIKELPQFDRDRARRVAQTEILTASSRSQWEAYKQSPAVVAKRWRHSGSKNNNPREAHVRMDGDEVPVDEPFDVNGHEGDYPRDPRLPADERIGCKCVMSPVTDRNILGLSQEEKEAIRQQVLDELED